MIAIKYATNGSLTGAITTTGVAVDSSTDFTGAVDISGLSANTRYWYTPVIDGVDQYTDNFPTFKTFPASGSGASFSFGFGSCTRHNGSTVDSIFNVVPPDVQFMLNLGDTIYADADGPGTVPASTLADFEGKHRNALSRYEGTSTGWRSLRAALPVFTTWDDHDLTDDFSAGTGSALYAPAKQAFQEYHARANPDSMTSGELYYAFQYGDVGFFVLDGRSFRSANTNTDNSSKTLLGATQKAALKSWLLTNKTVLKIKFVVTSTPAHGYAAFTAGDSWGGVDDGAQVPTGANGFRTERNEIWDYIDSNAIGGVVFLSGDQHWSGSFKTSYAGRPRYEFMASSFNSNTLTEVARAADPVNGPVFWKYDDSVSLGVVSVDTTASPPTVSFQLYGPSGTLGSAYLTSIDTDDIDAGI